MNKMIFLTNKVMSPKVIKPSRLPLTFISFGYAKGRMANKPREEDDTLFFYKTSNRPLYGDIAYGALFMLKDYEFHIPVLDALMSCTEAITAGLHQHLTIRTETQVTPISFDSLDDFSRLKYQEKDVVNAITYYANPKHPKIISRIKHFKYNTKNTNIHPEPFRELYEEVSKT